MTALLFFFAPRYRILAASFIFFAAMQARAQSCFTSDDMEPVTQSALVNTAKRYFDWVAKGDTTSLKQNSIADVAANFAGVEAAVKENQASFTSSQPTPRGPYLLKAEGAAPIARAEFLCGVFGTNGQTAHSAVFVIPNLPPGNYAVVTLDVPSAKGPYTVSFVLQQHANEWKLGGFYVKATQARGHDGNWFLQQAREYQAKNQLHNAWLYFLQARELLVPVPFMSTQLTDKIYDEAQKIKPHDLPSDSSVDLIAAGKTYKLTNVFPLALGNDLELVVKYGAADISNTAQTFQENVTVMKTLLAKYPEFRNAFDGIVARAVDPSGQDYGSMLPMAQIK